MKKVLNGCVTALLVFSALFLSAQGNPPPPPDTTSGPIDSGVLVLLVAVAVYGYIKLKQKEKSTITT